MKLRGELAAFAAFFTLLGVLAVVIGVHDFAIANSSFALTGVSLVLVAIGLAFGYAAWHLVELWVEQPRRGRLRPQCKGRVLVAFGLAAGLGVYVFLSALGTPSGQRPVVVAVSLLLVAASLAGVWRLWADASLRLPRLQTTVLLTVAGIVIGLSEFWYQNQYTPSHLGRAVSLSAGLTRVGEQNGYDLLRVKLDYMDVGGRDVAVIGSTYTLTGSRVVTCPRTATADKLQGVFDKFNVDPQRSRFMNDVWEVQPSTVLAAGKFVGDGKRLDANVPSSRKYVFEVPHGGYQLVRVRAQLFAISASVPLSRSALPQYLTIPGIHDEYGFWRVDDYSWLHALIYGRRRWVVMRYELGSKPTSSNASPDLRVTARFLHATWSEKPPSPTRLQAAFADGGSEPSDSSEPFADAELALAPVVAATAADSCPRGA